MSPSSDDDTSVVITRRSSPVVLARMWSASSQPISSPPSRRHEPSGCGIAAPRRSASGSLAIASAAPRSPARAMQQVHRPRLLRVRERHRRERRRRARTARRRRRAVEPGQLERRARGLATDAVHRRVGDGDAGDLGPEPDGGDRRAGRPSITSSSSVLDQRVVRRRPAPTDGRVDAVDLLGRWRRRGAARSGRRRRGTPCSRCRPAGCATPSPSRRRRRRAR